MGGADVAIGDIEYKMVKRISRTAGFFGATLLLILLCAAPLQAQGDEHGPVRAFIPTNFPPYYMLDPEGQPTGFAVDILNAVTKRANIDVEYTVEDSWLKIMEALSTGEADVLPSIGITQERQLFANFTVPIETVIVSIFVRFDSGSPPENYSLPGKTVGVVFKNVGHSLLRDMGNVNLVVYDDAVNALFGLLSGNVDAIVYPEPVLWNLARKAGVDNKIRTVGRPVAEIKRAIAVSKHHPEIYAKISTAVEALIGTPEYQAIYTKWFGKPTPFWTARKLTFVLIVSALIALMVALIASYLWRINRRLSSEITRRENLEADLKAHFHIYEMAINTPTMGFWVADPRGKFMEVNQAYVEMSGYTRAELLDMSISDIEAIENPQDTAQHISQLIETGHGRFKSAHKRKNGTVYPVEIATTFIRDQGGLFIVFIEDITEKVAYENNLESLLAERTKNLESEIVIRKKGELEQLKLSRAVEQSAHVIFITSPEGVIEYVNPKFTELLGYTREEAIGKTPSLIKSEDTTKEFHQNIWKAILSGQEWRGEIKDRRKNGDVFWASASISPVRNEHGDIINFVAVHEDITKRKEAQRALRNANRAAEIANKAKSDLLANMSHELRTPLNAIIGFSETMRHEIFGPLANDKYSEYAGLIYDSGLHLLQIINDILDVSAIEAGKLKLFEEDVDIIGVCDAAIRIIAPQAKEKHLTLKGLENKSLPLLRGDSLRLKQILINLLSNAVKFTPQGGAVFCDAFLNKDKSFVMTVTDTGVGMDEVGVAKAMEQFGQVDSSLNRKHEGTGLGLPLTKGLVELMQGRMEILSKPNEGTTVIITFPGERVPS